MAAPQTVQAYLARLAPERRAGLKKLRAMIRAAAPKETERISYDIPALFYRGIGLLSYAAWKDRYSIYRVPGAASLAKQLRPYVTGIGMLQFPADKPIPAALVKKVVQGS